MDKKHAHSTGGRGRIAALLVVGALAVGMAVGPSIGNAQPEQVTLAPDTHRTVAEQRFCLVDSSGGCNITHTWGERPTGIGIQESGALGFEKAVVNHANTTTTQFRVTFWRTTSNRFATGSRLDFTVMYHFGPLPPADTTAPDTTITADPGVTTESTSASFSFVSTENPSTFECKLDAGAFATCTTPKAYSGLAIGQHTFEVRATDSAGNTDLTPDTHVWEITAPPPPPPGIRPTWMSSGTPTLTFSDEFNDTAVDTTKWERGWFGEGLTDNVNSSNDNCYHTNQVSESGGYLHLVAISQPNTCKGVLRPYTSGMVTTRGKFIQRFGMVEARVCLPDGDANGKIDNFPAWWWNGMASGFEDGEIDVVEGLSDGDSKATVHYGAAHTIHGLESVDPYIGCHDFGAEWRLGNVKFYWDGVLLTNGTNTADFPFNVTSSAVLTLVLNQAVDDSHSPTYVPAGGNDLRVDWVRVWA
jgi:hypothetical protein